MHMRRIFVISDLHLGGRPDDCDDQGRITRPGYQICHTHAELVAFVRWVATQGQGISPPDLELVINGDLIDYLADDDLDDPSLRAQIWTAEEALAIRKLDRVVTRARVGKQGGVFESLRDFLAAGHRLTLLLGNHDVELALPAVRRHLVDLLGGEGVRLQFVYDGEAYTVGPVLIEHGNRYDHWNMINHSTLRQERSMRSRRLPVREDHRKERYFVVPAGTYLVIHFMNRIKARYRFIDLLKPETSTVVPLLLALEPRFRPHLADVIRAGPVALRPIKQAIRPALKEATVPRDGGNMADRGPGGAPHGGGTTLFDTGTAAGAAEAAAPADEVDLREHFVPDPNVSLDAVLAQELGPDVELFPAPAGGAGENMGLREKLRGGVDWLTGLLDGLAETVESASRYFRLATSHGDKQRLRQLHAALRCLNRDDRSFDLGTELPEYLDAAKETAELGNFAVVTYGHTHLPKKVPLGPGGKGPPWYFNTGTWCDVMRLPGEIAWDDPVGWGELLSFHKAIGANDFKRYIRRYLTFLEIEVEPAEGIEGVRKAELYSFGGDGHERLEPLTSVLDLPKGGGS
jgi:UDP-2,3-diacylglucosamine pyrophosphatase LpxH